MDRLCLFSYWRSSAAYRVRIGLNLKGLPYDIMPVHLLRDGGEQRKPDFREANPQMLVPVLQHGQRIRCCRRPRATASASARWPRWSRATSTR